MDILFELREFAARKGYLETVITNMLFAFFFAVKQKKVLVDDKLRGLVAVLRRGPRDWLSFSRQCILAEYALPVEEAVPAVDIQPVHTRGEFSWKPITFYWTRRIIEKRKDNHEERKKERKEKKASLSV